jgi:hypothetical protein
MSIMYIAIHVYPVLIRFNLLDHMFTSNMDSRDKQSNICIAPALQIILFVICLFRHVN